MRYINVQSPATEYAENITESFASVYFIKNREIIEYQPDRSVQGPSCGYSPFCQGGLTITVPDESVFMTTDCNMTNSIDKIVKKPMSPGYQKSNLALKDEADITQDFRSKI